MKTRLISTTSKAFWLGMLVPDRCTCASNEGPRHEIPICGGSMQSMFAPSARFFVLVLANLIIYLHLSSFISAFILFSMHVQTNLFAAQPSKYILGHILLHAQTKVSMALFAHKRLETGAFAERHGTILWLTERSPDYCSLSFLYRAVCPCAVSHPCVPNNKRRQAISVQPLDLYCTYRLRFRRRGTKIGP
jgi:hypothetical protein